MAMDIYVGNLAFETDEEKLKELFSQFGTVESVSLISDRETGRSRGFGFIKMSTIEEAQSAIGGLNGKDVDGRQLKVNESKPKTQSGNNRHGGKKRY